MNKTAKQKPQAGGQRLRGWNDADARAFADGVRLRASTIPHKRKPAPDVREWN